MVIRSQGSSLINFDPGEFEVCIAECAGIIVGQVCLKVSLREGYPKTLSRRQRTDTRAWAPSRGEDGVISGPVST